MILGLVGSFHFKSQEVAIVCIRLLVPLTTTQSRQLIEYSERLYDYKPSEIGVLCSAWCTCIYTYSVCDGGARMIELEVDKVHVTYMKGPLWRLALKLPAPLRWGSNPIRGSCQLLTEGCWFTPRNNFFLQLWKLTAIHNTLWLKNGVKHQVNWCFTLFVNRFRCYMAVSLHGWRK